MNIGLVSSKKVCGSPYLLGVNWDCDQVRIGFIWFQVVILIERDSHTMK